MYPHPIRLGEPWQRTPAESTVCYRRRFNSPTGLASREQVWLIVEEPAGSVRVECNGKALGEIATGQAYAEFLLSDCLKLHNELTLNVACDSDQANETTRGHVRLEIRLGPPPSL